MQIPADAAVSTSEGFIVGSTSDFQQCTQVDFQHPVAFLLVGVSAENLSEALVQYMNDELGARNICVPLSMDVAKKIDTWRTTSYLIQRCKSKPIKPKPLFDLTSSDRTIDILVKAKAPYASEPLLDAFQKRNKTFVHNL